MRTISPAGAGDISDTIRRTSDGMAGLAKGIAILEAFGAARTALSISDVSRMTEISKPSARRCLLTLTDLGYLQFDGRLFAPTRRVMRLGYAYVDTDPLNTIAQPHLDALRDRLQESVALTIWDEGETVIIARADADRILAMRGPVGRRMPGYCTASGRIFMAAMDAKQLETVVTQPLRAYTSRTISDPERLTAEVAKVREQGYALVDGEIEIGFLVIAVAVTSARGETIASLTVNSTSQRVSEDDARRDFLPPLLETAARISQLT
jgi:IclR family pca regulon transcriptional regulator